MTFEWAALLLLLLAVVCANVPWLSERPFLVMPPLPRAKPAWLRLVEWMVYYLLMLLLAVGLERKVNGVIHAQQWEFYAVTALMFAVLAMPGFIYHYDFRHYLKRYQKQKKQSA